MYARSLLGGLDHVDDRLESLLSLRSLCGHDRVLRLAGDVIAVLRELGEQLVTAAPFPHRDEQTAVDDGIAALLRTRWNQTAGSATDEVDETARSLAAGDRVRREGETDVVPLGADGPQARNWWPVLEVMADAVEELLADADSLVARSRASGCNGPVPGACRSIRRMLASLRDVCLRAVAERQFVRNRADEGQERPLRFAEWTATRIDGSDHV